MPQCLCYLRFLKHWAQNVDPFWEGAFPSASNFDLFKTTFIPFTSYRHNKLRSIWSDSLQTWVASFLWPIQNCQYCADKSFMFSRPKKRLILMREPEWNFFKMTFDYSIGTVAVLGKIEYSLLRNLQNCLETIMERPTDYSRIWTWQVIFIYSVAFQNIQCFLL